MRTLRDYILESTYIAEAENSKSITFDFKDLENGKETINSLKDKEGVEVSEESLTVTVNADNASKLTTVQDILQQYCQTIRSSQKRSSDEQYAQKTVAFEKKVGELNDAIDEFENPDEPEDEKAKEAADETK
jgi:hypothetical protein